MRSRPRGSSGSAGRKETGDLSSLPEVIDLLGEGKICQAVTVVGQECFFAVQIFFDCLQPLADVGIDARISKVMRQS